MTHETFERQAIFLAISSAAAGAPFTKPKNGPKSWVAVKPGR